MALKRGSLVRQLPDGKDLFLVIEVSVPGSRQKIRVVERDRVKSNPKRNRQPKAGGVWYASAFEEMGYDPDLLAVYEVMGT